MISKTWLLQASTYKHGTQTGGYSTDCKMVSMKWVIDWNNIISWRQLFRAASIMLAKYSNNHWYLSFDSNRILHIHSSYHHHKLTAFPKPYFGCYLTTRRSQTIHYQKWNDPICSTVRQWNLITKLRLDSLTFPKMIHNNTEYRTRHRWFFHHSAEIAFEKSQNKNWIFSAYHGWILKFLVLCSEKSLLEDGIEHNDICVYFYFSEMKFVKNN